MNREKRGFWSWFLQRITALLLVIGMSVHFFIFHFSPNRYVSRYYDEIIARFCTSGWITFHICLLALVIFHGLNGLWGIVSDFNLSKKTTSFFKQTLWFAGCVLFGAGIYILIWFATRNNSGF
jgi:succinate dehydrogenase / fumarate reductase membrane anchor subunit